MTQSKIARWLLSDMQLPKGVRELQAAGHEQNEEGVHPWWRVMCLTGVDYFSTLGYQPGIAFLAAGALSPVATLVLVLVTLFAALPVYNRVAAASPDGQGSVAMLQTLFPGWGGKVFVLALLGFATTDFIITMTLSAADASAHFTHNPFVPVWMRSQMAVTLVLLSILGAIFLKGFKEAINIAVLLVGLYLVLNGVVTAVAIEHVLHHPELIPHWKNILFTRHSNVFTMIGIAALLFPRLALGLSGFETGVAVMPLISAEDREQRIRNARRLLATAAIIMSVFLLATSFVTTLLIPASAFHEGGPANGRAMAYLAHQYMGSGFGAAYDASTILILAFAGASAMAGLLNLIPRYLPGFGMAPEWARASRPLVLVFLGVAFAVTLLFHADVDAQGGAYATGVLVLITSASYAVTISAKGWWPRIALGSICAVFVYTTLVNIAERPEGLKIATVFILTMILLSLISRALRSTELRVNEVELDESAKALLAEEGDRTIRLIPWSPEHSGREQREVQMREIRWLHGLGPEETFFFIEIERSDTSEFSEKLCLSGRQEDSHRILYGCNPVVANSIAALLICIGKSREPESETTPRVPHAYFTWTEINPVWGVMRFIFLGEGDNAPLTHEVLRRAIADPERRPVIHVA